MSRLICADFDEFEEALYGVEGRYLLRSRQQRDWRLHVVELDGVALMFGREGRARSTVASVCRASSISSCR